MRSLEVGHAFEVVSHIVSIVISHAHAMSLAGWEYLQFFKNYSFQIFLPLPDQYFDLKKGHYLITKKKYKIFIVSALWDKFGTKLKCE